MSEFKNKVYKIEDFINLVKEKKERVPHYNLDYCYDIYIQNNALKLHSEIYVGDSVEVNDDDEEIYPEFAIKNGYHYFCSDQNVQDVVDLALRQNPKVTMEKLIDALNYYLKFDDFIDQ